MSELVGPSEITFPTENDPFDPFDNSTLEDLGTTWIKYAEVQFGETETTRLKQLEALKERIIQDGLKDHVDTIIATSNPERFYLKILRAGLIFNFLLN